LFEGLERLLIYVRAAAPNIPRQKAVLAAKRRTKRETKKGRKKRSESLKVRVFKSKIP
jgi:hypothetical protein